MRNGSIIFALMVCLLWVSQVHAAACREYIAMGDSVTAGGLDDPSDNDGYGFVGIMANMRPDVTFHREGIAGMSLAVALHRGMPEELIEKWPDACGMLVLMGVNDAAIFRNLQQYIDNLFVLRDIAKHEKMTMWVATFPASLERRPLRADMNMAIRAMTSKRGRFRPGPDFGSFFDRNPWYLVDGIHPDPRGHVAMALMWFRTLGMVVL